jgi:hypothetical protein
MAKKTTESKNKVNFGKRKKGLAIKRKTKHVNQSR